VTDAERPEIRDRRRVDPKTGAVREPAPGRPGSGSPADKDVVDDIAGDLVTELAEELADAEAVEEDLSTVAAEAEAELAATADHLADLQRLKAEFDNYRRRVERDRDLVRELAVGATLANLLPVLDDIERADSHDELVGGFKSVADNLLGVLTKAGLETFGDTGDTFDPAIHEALTHSFSDDVDEPTCVQVLQRGYRYSGRVLRPARVAVAEPKDD